MPLARTAGLSRRLRGAGPEDQPEWALGPAGEEASASLPRGRGLQRPWGPLVESPSPRAHALSPLQKVAYAITPEKERELVDRGEVRQFTVSAGPQYPLRQDTDGPREGASQES